MSVCSHSELRNISPSLQLSAHCIRPSLQRALQQLPSVPPARGPGEDRHDDVRRTGVRRHILQQLHQLADTVPLDGAWNILDICVIGDNDINESVSGFGS